MSFKYVPPIANLDDLLSRSFEYEAHIASTPRPDTVRLTVEINVPIGIADAIQRGDVLLTFSLPAGMESLCVTKDLQS